MSRSVVNPHRVLLVDGDELEAEMLAADLSQVGYRVETCAGGRRLGMRRFAVTHGHEGWKLEERWASRGLRPNHNDSVVHDGHVYGFNGARLACIDVKDGARRWKAERYAGFTILLADQGLLLVLTEKGEVALVEATPDGFTELARLQAIEGRTWNVPALAGDVLLVRNAREMAAFRLPRAGTSR